MLNRIRWIYERTFGFRDMGLFHYHYIYPTDSSGQIYLRALFMGSMTEALNVSKCLMKIEAQTN